MNGAEPIEVNDLVSLLRLIQQSEFWVQWRVRCEIGPEWTGGQRSIQFYLDQQPLADTSLHDQLKNVLVKKLDIPETSPDAVIRGAGTITRKNNTLEIEYEWSETVPYMYSRDGGYGTTILMALP